MKTTQVKTKVEESSSHQSFSFSKKAQKNVDNDDKNFAMLKAKSAKLENWKIRKSYEKVNGIGENNTSVR